LTGKTTTAPAAELDAGGLLLSTLAGRISAFLRRLFERPPQ
jgi:hypothetical protein